VSVALRATKSIAGGWLSATLAAVGVALLLPLTTFLVSAWLLGWQLQSVQSASMTPTYAVGSLLVVAAVDPADVAPGTPIVFQDPRDPARLVTHRVVDIVAGTPPAFITKGDANAAQDAVPVGPERVRGEVLWSVTHLGTLMEWLQWPRSLVLIAIPGLLLALDGWRGRRLAKPATDTGEPVPAARAS
jgi:signal peptidase